MPRARNPVPTVKWRNGVAYATWYDPIKRQTMMQTLGVREPAAVKGAFEAFLREGPATRPKGGLTVSEALDQYLFEHVRKHCADPRRQEDAIVHLKAFFGSEPLAAVDVPMSHRYAAARRSGAIGVESRRSGKSRCAVDSTIRRELNVLVAASNHAKKWRRITVLPSVERPPERRLGPDDEAPFFTKDELASIFDMAPGDLLHFVTLAYWTGARRQSVQDLTRGQVRRGYGGGHILLQRPGKQATKKRQPIVPILPEMAATIDALCAAAEAAKRERLFVRDFYRPFRMLCLDLGIGEDRAHPHVLRHTRATHLLQDGVSLYSVARLLGDTVATIERVYGHHSHAALRDEIGGRG